MGNPATMHGPTIRTAFILGAGLGLRLRPLTEHCPKPLLPVRGRPLITHVMDHCLTAGVERFIVNTHHLPAAYAQAFPDRSWRGRPIHFCHEPILLDTAGGIKNIEPLLAPDETLLVYNGDILSDLPLERLLQGHAGEGKEVTLALRSEGPLKNVALDAAGHLCDLRGLLGNPGVRQCLFTGIYVLERCFLRRLTPGKVESVIPVLAEMIRQRPGSVGAVVIDNGTWQDIGDRRSYEQVRAGKTPLHYGQAGIFSGRRGCPAATGEPLLGRAALRDAAAGSGPAVDQEKTDFIGSEELPDQAKAPNERPFLRALLGLPPGAGIGLVPVGKGGSDRQYSRVTIHGRGSFVLMRYGKGGGENGLYAAIAGFLKGIGVAVPDIVGHDPRRGLLLLEDLGDEDLFSCRDAPWEHRRRLYEQTLTLILRLHAFPPERFPLARIPLMAGFGPELYRWERDYFRNQCVERLCGICLTDKEGRALEEELETLARQLMEMPRVLVHRDLQSQNIMVRDRGPVLIDFQGMRFGNLFYDLGSLLYDPYVAIPDEECRSLLRYYYDLSRTARPWDDFERLFRQASAQRLMQALGAYGFLGLERKKRHFLAHAAPALERLITVTGATGTLPLLHALACRCRAALPAEIS